MMGLILIVLLVLVAVLTGLFYKQRIKINSIQQPSIINIQPNLESDDFNTALLKNELEKRILEIENEKGNLTLEKEKLAEKNKRMWAMNEAVYKEKKKVDEELEKLNEEKAKLEQAKNKLDDKVKKLWATSTAVHKEKERINIIKQ